MLEQAFIRGCPYRHTSTVIPFTEGIKPFYRRVFLRKKGIKPFYRRVFLSYIVGHFLEIPYSNGFKTI